MPGSTWLSDVYRASRRELFLAAWTVLRRADLAEDAVHAAFARLLAQPEPPRDPKVYAPRSVRNAAVDMAKSRSRRREEPLKPEWDGPAPRADEAHGDTIASLAEALERLDPPSREVVELRLHAGLTFQEIARTLEEPLSTVASRYRRALEKLGREVGAPYG